VFVVIAPISWIFLAVTAFLSLKWRWLLIVFVGVVLGLANLIGYLLCAKGKTHFFSFLFLSSFMSN
jgi:hypothetical protein